MTPRIWLPITEAKCIASACRYPGKCARMTVAMDQGRPLTDYSMTPSLYATATCAAPAWSKRIDPAAAGKPVDQPQVKEWIGGRI